MDAPLAIVLVGAAVFLSSPLLILLAAVIVGRRFAIILWFWRRASPRRAALGYASLSGLLLLIPLPGLIGTGDYVLVAEWLVGVVVICVLTYGFVELVLRSLGGEFDAKPVQGDIRRGDI
jgi:hypothetical protein